MDYLNWTWKIQEESAEHPKKETFAIREARGFSEGWFSLNMQKVVIRAMCDWGKAPRTGITGVNSTHSPCSHQPHQPPRNPGGMWQSTQQDPPQLWWIISPRTLHRSHLTHPENISGGQMASKYPSCIPEQTSRIFTEIQKHPAPTSWNLPCVAPNQKVSQVQKKKKSKIRPKMRRENQLKD